MKKYICVFILFIIAKCGSEDAKYNMIIKGNVEGLRKGTLYLQKIEDTLLLNVDSLKIKGNSNFILKYNIESPEIFYLYLDKEDGDTLNDRVKFFGEKGIIHLNTQLKTFESSAIVKGSENQSLLEKYEKMIHKFNDANLDLIKEYYNAQNLKDKSKMDEIDEKLKSLEKRKYLYTINFASSHADKSIAPYLAISEIPDINPMFLDTLYQKLSTDVLNRKYGRLFTEYLEELKKIDTIKSK